MASDFPDAPKVLKGAIVMIALPNPVPTVVAFQYDPDALTRGLEARGAKGQEGTNRGEAQRLSGPPRETLSCAVELDGTEAPLGVTPPLAALELLLYPPTVQVIAKKIAAAAGLITVIEPPAPLTLFVWGPQRVLPVRLTGMTITEEAFSPNLVPVRAKVDLKMEVLSWYDLPSDSPAHALALARQVVGLEALSKLNTATSLAGLGVSLPL
jgi:hypothetical protein